MRKHGIVLSLCLIIVFLVSTSLFAQTKPRVAILPFTAVKVPTTDARTVFSLFEIAMVKADVYEVLEQNRIDEILDAQAFSLSGCTDDACAVEVGKLLSAEFIIMGELSKVGDRYIATAKVVDVGLGKNVNADSVTATDINEMTDTAITLLAYKLAGLTYSEGSGERIAEAFGEIFLTTEPAGAEVFVNGMKRGTSPLIIQKIPLGKTIIRARKDNLVGERTVELESSELLEMEIVLKISLGRLFIRSSEPDMEVFLDRESLGPLSSGLFKDLPSGEHTLSLKGNGMFWEDTVIIEEEKTVTIEVYPKPFGTLSYELPEGTVCDVSGAGEREQLTGSGGIHLSTGSYIIRVSGEQYLKYEERIEIEQGKTTHLIPKLEYSEEYQKELRIQDRKEAESYYTKELEDLEVRIGEGGDVRENALELKAVRELRSRIEQSRHDFPEFLEAADLMLMKILKIKVETLQKDYDQALIKRRSMRTLGIAGFGVGGAALAGTGLSFFLGGQEYERYLATDTSDAALESHNLLNLYSVLNIAGLVLTAAGVITGFIAPGAGPDPEAIASEIAEVRAEIAEIKEGM